MSLLHFTNFGPLDVPKVSDKAFGGYSFRKEIFSTLFWLVEEVKKDGKWTIDDWLEVQDNMGNCAILNLLSWLEKHRGKSVLTYYLFLFSFCFVLFLAAIHNVVETYTSLR